MKIGLVDVDGHAHKKKWGATIYPNLALGKLARYHRERGDEVEWAIPFYHYDRLYMSKIFNFSPDDLTCYDAAEVIKGGTGYDIASKLPAEVEAMQPDYSIWPNVPADTAYGFLTRGCPNRCPWCVVPKKEGGVKPYMDVEEIAIEGRHKLVLMDNNILAAGEYAVEQFEKIIRDGYSVDFNQALDARLVDDRFAQLMARMSLAKRIRFGCDTPGQVKECQRAIDMLQGYGYRGEFFLYTMLTDNFAECYQRTRYWWEKNHEYRREHRPNVYIHAQPFRDPFNPARPVPQWQKDMAAWANKKMVFQVTSFENFSPRKGFKCSQYLTNLLTSIK